jgi:hypothetical protein
MNSLTIEITVNTTLFGGFYMRKIAILSVLLMASACTTMSDDAGMDGDVDLSSLISQAAEENKKAAAAGGLWRDADKMIKKAKTAMEKGDAKKAMKLAKQALAQGKLGQAQSKAEKNAGPWLF